MTQPQPSPTPMTPDKPSPLSPGSASCWLSELCACQWPSADIARIVNVNVSSEPTNRSDFDVSTTSDLASVRVLTIHRDNRGNVRETYRASWFPQVPPIKQLVRSKSKPKTLRGMHRHLAQWDVWHLVRGSALVRTYDHETGRNTYTWAGPGVTIAIPPRLSHGFYTPDGCILMYGLTNEYDGTDEYGWRWSDGLSTAVPPEFQEEWPTDPTGLNISERDLTAPRLVDFDGAPS